MHRILLKVSAHEMPSADEISFLRGIKIEVLERFNGPSMRVNLATSLRNPSSRRCPRKDTKAPREQGFWIGAPRFELGTSSPPD